jgi:hypothetical protein
VVSSGILSNSSETQEADDDYLAAALALSLSLLDKK